MWVQVAHQSPAVLGLALIAKAEDLGSFMAQRTLEHLLQYGEPPVRSHPTPADKLWP
jgi:26S proteasome regulatory subunit N1